MPLVETTQDGAEDKAGDIARPHLRLAELLAPEMAEVGAEISLRMASENAPRIPQVTAHLVEAGGKRLRPLLTVAAARAFGYDGRADILLATAVEFIHTATLLHDDVVDESDKRRGRPTANLLWDNKSSVLVGDYLFARSFRLMVETGSIRVLDILSDAAATIAEGEVLQLTTVRNLGTDEATYLRVVRGKTAALFAAACEAGAVVAGADEKQVRALRDYGDALGIAFQMVDDLLDYGGSDAIGKNTGDDFREGKPTLPLIKAVGADPEGAEFWTRVIERRDQREGDFEAALARIEATGAMKATRAEALAWAERAKGALTVLPEGEIRDLLSQMAAYVVDRIL